MIIKNFPFRSKGWLLKLFEKNFPYTEIEVIKKNDEGKEEWINLKDVDSRNRILHDAEEIWLKTDDGSFSAKITVEATRLPVKFSVDEYTEVFHDLTIHVVKALRRDLLAVQNFAQEYEDITGRKVIIYET